MTIKEKQKAIRSYCHDTLCTRCALFNTRYPNCWSEFEHVEESYKILFGEDTHSTDKNRIPDVCANCVNAESNHCMECFEHSRFIKRKADNVNHPSHYETGKFECIDVMLETQGVEAVKNFCLCNAFKYLYRHNKKNGVEDIKKARWYINKYLELEGEQKND